MLSFGYFHIHISRSIGPFKAAFQVQYRDFSKKDFHCISIRADVLLDFIFGHTPEKEKGTIQNSIKYSVNEKTILLSHLHAILVTINYSCFHITVFNSYSPSKVVKK